MVVGVAPGQVRRLALGDELLGLLLEHVRQALQEQEPEDEVLVVRGVDGAPEDVRGAPEIPLQLVDRELVGGRLGAGLLGGAVLPSLTVVGGLRRRFGLDAEDASGELVLLATRPVEAEGIADGL